MAIFDFKIKDTGVGEFDIELPLVKIGLQEDMLFQQVNLILNTYTEEFVYDITAGMPYDEILTKGFDFTKLESIYFDKISELVYFKDMKDFLVDVDSDRNYAVTFTVIALNNKQQVFTLGL